MGLGSTPGRLILTVTDRLVTDRGILCGSPVIKRERGKCLHLMWRKDVEEEYEALKGPLDVEGRGEEVWRGGETKRNTEERFSQCWSGI